MSKQYPGGLITKTPVTPTQSAASGVWTLDQQAYWQGQGQWPLPGYRISRSLRFNSADSAYLNRTPASASNRTTWTWSGWIKRGQLGALQAMFTAGGDSPAARGLLEFEANDDIRFGFNDGTSWYLASTSAVFRDPSAWYHIVVSLDLTNGTNANRVKLYVNNVLQSFASTPTWPTTDQVFNNNVVHRLGSYYGSTPSNFLSGYATEINFIDGQALTPSSFGETNADTGVWQPKAYSGSYGTNGFYLNFSDNSNTTAATLGKDYSGNGNNWTPNNFSVTAGSGNDSMVDSPTPYGTDTGAGGTVRGNYATLNPLRFGTLSRTFTDGNLAVAANSGNFATTATIGVSSGKWYWEITATLVTDNRFVVGVADSTWPGSDLGDTAYSYGYIADARKYNNGSTSSYGATYTTNDIIGVALDMDAGTLTFYKNGTSQGQAFSGITQQMFPAIGSTGGAFSESGVANFGQRPFAYTAPSGYKALCTQNLPTPTIGATSTTLATKYFGAFTYTGNGAASSNTTQNITTPFYPDLAWVKGRDSTYYHRLTSTGLTLPNYLATNASDAQGTANDQISALASTYFQVKASGSGGTNQSGSTYVGWTWNANNGTTVSNTAGSITSTVSANTTSGFSVVTWTANGLSNRSIGHGLGVAPSVVFVKDRTSALNWNIWFTGFTADEYLILNNTGAKGSYSTVWWQVPTSTVFYVGTSATAANYQNGDNYVAYCWAEVAGYSKFGQYTGNGSADGPFVYTGFRPAFLLVKAISGTSAASANWLILDATRNTYNETNNKLAPNLTDTENSGTIGNSSQNNYDFLSNGFKARTTNGSSNENASVYIYMAFAESPFKTSLAR